MGDYQLPAGLVRRELEGDNTNRKGDARGMLSEDNVTKHMSEAEKANWLLAKRAWDSKSEAEKQAVHEAMLRRGDGYPPPQGTTGMGQPGTPSGVAYGRGYEPPRGTTEEPLLTAWDAIHNREAVFTIPPPRGRLVATQPAAMVQAVEPLPIRSNIRNINIPAPMPVQQPVDNGYKWRSILDFIGR